MIEILITVAFSITVAVFGLFLTLSDERFFGP